MIQEEASIPASFVHCGPHSFTPGHIRSSLPHSFIPDPHSFIPGHIFHLKNWLNCHLQEKLVVDNNPESAKLEEVSIVQNVTI